jgi:hypothetical protein
MEARNRDGRCRRFLSTLSTSCRQFIGLRRASDKEHARRGARHLPIDRGDTSPHLPGSKYSVEGCTSLVTPGDSLILTSRNGLLSWLSRSSAPGTGFLEIRCCDVSVVSAELNDSGPRLLFSYSTSWDAMDDPTCQRPIAVQERNYMGFSDHAYGTIRFEEIRAEKRHPREDEGRWNGKCT